MQLCSHPPPPFEVVLPICNSFISWRLETKGESLAAAGEGMRERLRLSVRFRLTGLHLGH
jgi:hypothetical protein